MTKLLGIGAAIAIIVLGVMLAIEWPTPLTDANRQVLATSRAEAYCAGEVFAQTNGNGDAGSMEACVEESSRSTEREVKVVQAVFCRAFFHKTGYDEPTCQQIMQAYQYWPTMKGTITNSWNRSFPYPLDAVTTGDSAGGRTQDRDTNEREGGFRP